MASVAVVIVTYNSEGEIGGCLDALERFEDLEILVVDNASADGTCAEVTSRNVSLIANTRNAGFAGAVNQGVGATSSPLVLLLNPDAHLERGIDTLEGCLAAGAGAAGGVLLGTDGHPQLGFMARNLPTPTALIFEVLGVNRLWPGNPANWHYKCYGLEWGAPALVEQPAGAFLMFTREAFHKVGGFDERFWPVWFEDVDFCAKLKRAGYRVYLHPEAVARHSGGHSVGTLPLEIRELYWYGSLLEYGAKYYSAVTLRILCFAVLIGAVLRGVSAGVRRGRTRGSWTKAFAVYGAVAHLAVSRMFRRTRGQGITAV